MSPRNYAKEYKKETESVKFIHIRIPRDTKERLTQKLYCDGLTLSKWILDQVDIYLDEPPK